MSVKRNVTVPLGNSSIATTSDPTRALAQRSKLLQPTELVEARHRRTWVARGRKTLT